MARLSSIEQAIENMSVEQVRDLLETKFLAYQARLKKLDDDGAEWESVAEMENLYERGLNNLDMVISAMGYALKETE